MDIETIRRKRIHIAESEPLVERKIGKRWPISPLWLHELEVETYE